MSHSSSTNISCLEALSQTIIFKLRNFLLDLLNGFFSDSVAFYLFVPRFNAIYSNLLAVLAGLCDLCIMGLHEWFACSSREWVYTSSKLWGHTIQLTYMYHPWIVCTIMKANGMLSLSSHPKPEQSKSIGLLYRQSCKTWFLYGCQPFNYVN